MLSRPNAVNLVNLSGDGRTSGAYQFDIGYNRRFELADLDYFFIAGAWRHRQVTIALGAAQFGKSDLYAEQLLKGSISVTYRAFTLGVAPSALQIQIGNGYGALRAAALGAGATYSARTFMVNVVADNLTSPKLLEHGGSFKPTYTLVSEYFGHRAFSVVGRVRAESGQNPQFGLGQWIRLNERSAFFWGVAGEPTEYGGGVEIDMPFGAATYAVAIHPVLGLTHTVTVSYQSKRAKSTHGGEFD